MLTIVHSNVDSLQMLTDFIIVHSDFTNVDSLQMLTDFTIVHSDWACGPIYVKCCHFFEE